MTTTTSDQPGRTKNLLVPILGGLLVAITTPAGSTVREVSFLTHVTLTGTVESDGSPVGSAAVRVDDHGPSGSTGETGWSLLAAVDNGPQRPAHRRRRHPVAHPKVLPGQGCRRHRPGGRALPETRLLRVSESTSRVGHRTRSHGRRDALAARAADEALRAVQDVAHSRPAPLERDQVRSFC